MLPNTFNMKIISAGAGSGKTYRLTEEMVALLESGEVRPEGIVATTFTALAAAELRERVAERLLQKGLHKAAHRLPNALIGTVHGLGVKLLNRFAYEAGIPPKVNIMAEEDRQYFFNQALSNILHPDRADAMDALAESLAQVNPFSGKTFWRTQVKDICDLASVNKLDVQALELSKQRSVKTLLDLLGTPSDKTAQHWKEKLRELLVSTIELLEGNEDETKLTSKAVQQLSTFLRELDFEGRFSWLSWAKVSKIKVGKKSEADVAALKAFAEKHYQSKQLHEELNSFISMMFDLAVEALQEYENFKKQRGLIDYNDMEALVYELLDHPEVRDALQREIDLLMVDEFQDTSPIQLAIFLKLSKLAKQVIWVGDPKQSIYGFRGAEPELMQALLKQRGGLEAENILSYSWRSREEIVYAVNAHFKKAFPYLPEEQICLEPKRRAKADEQTLNQADEPIGMQAALQHWYVEVEGEKPKPGNADWFDLALARQIRTWLDDKPLILPKGERKNYRPLQPSDVAVLCRRNERCKKMAKALNQMGLRAAIYREGLLETREVRLMLACVKYILNEKDALSSAEILLLASGKKLEEIADSRLRWLYEDGKQEKNNWEAQDEFLMALNALRSETLELSASELLQLLQDRLDLRRIVVRWGQHEQRLANLEMLMRFTQEYESRCDRLHTAASVGGLLIWLNALASAKKDWQGFSEDEQAVKVLTYHKSKGLEFPAVICYELESGLRTDGIWRLQVVPPEGELQPERILEGRWLRFWVNPYGKQLSGTVLDERLQESCYWKEEREKTLNELSRLLYVGMTRARDYLIFPSRFKRPMAWLDITFNLGEEGPPVLDPELSETPWMLGEEPLLKQNRHAAFPEKFEVLDPPKEELFYLRPSQAEVIDFPPYELDWQNSKTLHADRAFEEVFSCAPPVNRKNVEEQAAFLKALKVLAKAFCFGLFEEQELEQFAETLLQKFSLTEGASASILIRPVKAFCAAWTNLREDASLTLLQVAYPLHLVHEGYHVHLSIDSLWVDEKGALSVLQMDDSSKWSVAKKESWSRWADLLEKHLPVLLPHKTYAGAYLYVLAEGKLYRL